MTAVTLRGLMVSPPAVCNGGSAVHTANFTVAEAASAQATALKQQFVVAWWVWST